MFTSQKIFIVSLLISKIRADDFVSDDDVQENIERKDQNKYKAERRFLDDLDDSQWHVSHLKSTDFALKSDCVEDTFEDKVRKYRKSLQNDGARVNFVSADALPFNVKDLRGDKVCDVPDTKEGIKVKLEKEREQSTDDLEYVEDEKENPEEDKEKVNVATVSPDKKIKSVKEKARRASEYAFSSVEYYDDTELFPKGRCPDAVEVIDLQLDVIRDYDIRCERMLMWKSLDEL